MNNNLSLISLQPDLKQNYSYNILDKIKVDIDILDNPYNIPLDMLFGMAARMNKKRSFLFVSKVLGKHLPVDPAVSLLIGAALAARYAEKVYGMAHPYMGELISGITGELDPNIRLLDYHIELPEPTLFIGFAETATALGHSVFEVCDNAAFFHTTREQIDGLPSVINFEEEHSHATSHRSYVDPALIDNDHPIVLVDDEVTTGKTAINIIESIQARFPRRTYTIVSILDWRTEENREAFRELERRLGITIHEISLVYGTIQTEGSSIEGEQEASLFPQLESTVETIDLSEQHIPLSSYYSVTDQNTPYLQNSGRFGIYDYDKLDIYHWMDPLASHLKSQRKGERTLCLGTGEFMYLPMKIASQMGEGVSYQSTTRSPIHPADRLGYAITHAFSYISPETEEVMNYFYNIEPGMYDEVFVFLEREMPEKKLEPLLSQLKKVVPSIRLVPLSAAEKEG
ncbi:phosphoribosyltransferase family protein [Peribacillus deserti]|uniref:Adenine/guanine phosphoribosyltransferase n=1 Tax=Peribacillus deserti TaxID=673318 RepID=A0A2N5M9R7_9BACI|nr:phosphoribosyltransferase family protein [Peribacillus deserti]PLT31099.1 adenine/guanine phosphoribosyltransferase [Peribacillus deserti]